MTIQLTVFFLITGLIAQFIAPAVAQEQKTPVLPPLNELLDGTRRIVVARCVGSVDASENDPSGTEFVYVRSVPTGADLSQVQGLMPPVVYVPPASELRCKPGDHRILGFYVLNSHTFIWWPLKLDDTQRAVLERAPKATREHPEAALLYWVEYLKSPDPVLQRIAELALVDSSIENLFVAAKSMPASVIRDGYTDQSLDESCRQQLTKMLAIVGNQSDLEALSAKLAALEKLEYPDRDEVVSTMVPLLIRNGEKELSKIAQSWIDNPKAEFNRRHAGFLALELVASRPESTVPVERILAAIAPLVSDPNFTDLVLRLFAWHRNWSLHSKLQEMFEKAESSSTKVLILRYLIASQGDSSATSAAQQARREAAEVLAALRKTHREELDELEKSARIRPFLLKPVGHANR